MLSEAITQNWKAVICSVLQNSTIQERQMQGYVEKHFPGYQVEARENKKGKTEMWKQPKH